MSEEQTCLVQPRSDSENSTRLTGFGSLAKTMAYTESGMSVEGCSPEGPAAAPAELNSLDNDSGELIDYDDASQLSAFHDEAMAQTGFGCGQLRAVAACALGVLGAAVEQAAVPLALPSAALELCLAPRERAWLGLMPLVGQSVGALPWAALAARAGRRRALLSALAVNALFATVAAFTPTYGTSVMARLCSGIASGGILPCVYCLLAELCPRRRARWALASVLVAAAAGALAAAALAAAALPADAAAALRDSERHFSAWHRYLLMCTLPLLAAMVCLLWSPESPRFLLDARREAEACAVYQELHRTNQLVPCGKRRGEGDAYRANELSLPSKRRPPATHQFWHTFLQLFSSTYRRSTLSLTAVLAVSLSLQAYLSTYVPTTVERQEVEKFEANRVVVQNGTFANEYYNKTIENIVYANCTFVNCTFRELLMSHVSFKNCSFTNATMVNIKASYTRFEGVQFYNSSIIDTDISVSRELDPWCTLNSTILRGVNRRCSAPWRARLAARLLELRSEIPYVAGGGFAAAALAVVGGGRRDIVLLSAAMLLLAPALYLCGGAAGALYAAEAAGRALAALAAFDAAVVLVERYAARARCIALGAALSAAYLCAALAQAGGAAGAGAAGGAAVVGALAALGLGAALAVPRVV